MKHYGLLLWVCCSLTALGQQGGGSAFQFLHLDFNSRSMALGGDVIALKDDDINLSVSNPAAITPAMQRQLSFNHVIYPSGIHYGQLAYGGALKGAGTWVGHLRYLSYGRFARTDAAGNEQGTFTAGDYALGVGYAYALHPNLSVGAHLNGLFAHYESYTSVGLSADMALTFQSENRSLTASLVARHIGVQLKGFAGGRRDALPLELLTGVTYKLPHAPFRLSLMVTDLNRWDLTYNDPRLTATVDPLTGDTVPPPKATFIQKLSYHTVFGVELLPSDRFSIRGGFNFARRDGLGVEGRKGLSGFSLGVGMHLKRFRFDYGLAFYSVAGASNAFTLTFDLDTYRTKRTAN